MKKSVFREKYVVKEVVDKTPAKDVSRNDENEKSSILEVGPIKVSRRKSGDK